MATRRNIVIDQGSTFSSNVKYRTRRGAVVPLTDYAARMQFRPEPDSDTVILSALSTGADPELAVDGANGIVTITLSPATTAALPAGVLWFDLEVFTVGEEIVKRIADGKVFVRQEVTR